MLVVGVSERLRARRLSETEKQSPVNERVRGWEREGWVRLSSRAPVDSLRVTTEKARQRSVSCRSGIRGRAAPQRTRCEGLLAVKVSMDGCLAVYNARMEMESSLWSAQSLTQLDSYSGSQPWLNHLNFFFDQKNFDFQ